MHIPDGYLSPQTYIPLYVAFASFVALAIKKLKKTLDLKLIPYLGMASAFSFLIMMFNVPIPGGTTGHAVGAAIIAVVFGPWVAIVSVSTALIIQAFVFGDGGITAIGANCFNMAVVMPLIAVMVFKLIKNKKSSNCNLAAFLSGYISLVFAALITAIEFGIQPMIAAAENGQPLYAPYPLSVAVPVMAIEHLALFGIIEGIVTMIVFRYFMKTEKDIIYVLK